MSFLRELGTDVLMMGELIIRLGGSFVVAWIVSRIANSWLVPFLASRKYGRDGAILIGQLVAIIAYVIAFVSVLNQIGANWTGILTLLSAFTVAIGLSLQDVMKNFFSGVLMLLERPFSVGDRVKVRDHEGEIRGINVRTTLMRNLDGELVLIPNSILFSEILTNNTHWSTATFRFTANVSAADFEGTSATIHQILTAHVGVRQPLREARIVSSSPDTGITERYAVSINLKETTEAMTIAAVVDAAPQARIEVLP